MKQAHSDMFPESLKPGVGAAIEFLNSYAKDLRTEAEATLLPSVRTSKIHAAAAVHGAVELLKGRL